MKLFLFEWKKLWKKRVTWAVMICSFLAISSLQLFIYSRGESIHETNMTTLQNTTDHLKEHGTKIKEKKRVAEKDGEIEKIAEATESMKLYEKMSQDTAQVIRAYEEQDWKGIHQYWQQDLKWMEGISSEAEYFHSIVEGQKENMKLFTLRATVEEIKWLEKHDLQPTAQDAGYFRPAYLATIYDDFTGSAVKEWERTTKRYATTGWSFMYQLIQYAAIPVFILLGCLAFGNNVTSEMSKKKRGLYFYYVLPIKRIHVFVAKYVSGLVMILIFVSFMFLVPLGISLFTDGIGSLKYPVLVYDGATPSLLGDEFTSLSSVQDTFHFISLQEYMGQACVLLILSTILIYSIYYVISLIVKSGIIALVLTALLTFGGMKLGISPYNPFTYMDMHKIINGETAAIALNKAIHFQNGVLSMSLFVCVFIVGGYVMSKRIK